MFSAIWQLASLKAEIAELKQRISEHRAVDDALRSEKIANATLQDELSVLKERAKVTAKSLEMV